MSTRALWVTIDSRCNETRVLVTTSSYSPSTSLRIADTQEHATAPREDS
jgi:hypothetical protein